MSKRPYRTKRRARSNPSMSSAEKVKAAKGVLVATLVGAIVYDSYRRSRVVPFEETAREINSPLPPWPYLALGTAVVGASYVIYTNS
jgi:hypothetical protein